MANIILINDQDQAQTLTGVSKLVTRGESGNIEFSIGGGGAVSGWKTVISGNSEYGTISAPAETAAAPAKVVALAETVQSEYILPFQAAEGDKPAIQENKIQVANNTLELSRPTGENCPPFNGEKQEDGKWKNESWEWDGSKVTGTVEAINDGTGIKNFKDNKGILRITNISENTLKVSFNYGLEFFSVRTFVTKGTLKIGDNNPIETNSTGPFAAQISAGEFIDVLVTVQGYQNWSPYRLGAPHATLNITDITAETVSGSGEKVTLLAPGIGGSYTYKKSTDETATTVSGDTDVSYSIANNESVTLRANASSGYKFYLWEDENGIPLSTQETITIDGINVAPVSVKPIFIGVDATPIYNILLGTRSGDYYYWVDAMNAAAAGGQINLSLKTDLTLDDSTAYSRKSGEAIINNTFFIPPGVALGIVGQTLTIPAGVSLATPSGRPLDIKAAIQFINK